MLIKKSDNQWFKAGDMTTLAEILHPRNINLNLPFSIANAFLEKGETSLLHSLAETEIYFITNGSGEFSLNGMTVPIAKGDTIIVHPGVAQSLKNTSDLRLEFLCIVTPPWTNEGEKILE